MHRFLKSLTGISVAAGWGLMTLTAPAVPAHAQAAQAQPAAQGQPAKKVKDQGEYDLYNGSLKATDPNEKVKLLTTWKEKYPETEYKEERLTLLALTYYQLGKVREAYDSAKELLGVSPKDITALFYITSLTPAVYSTTAPTPDALDTAEKAANGLLNAEMPATTKPEDWAKLKKETLEPSSHKTLGWVAMQRKNFEVAEQELTKSLEINPNQGEASYWLGTAMLQSRKPEKTAPGLYSIARAVVLDPARGGLPEAGRKQIEAYLNGAYTKFHGSAEGLDQLKAQARNNALPPAGFTIKTGAEIEAAKEEEFKKANPSLALWMGLKKELQAANGEQFFENTMKNANVPGGASGINMLRGHLISAKPATASKELVIGVEKPDVPEVTLKLENPLKGKPVVGSTVDFEGVPTAFTKEPFMVTFEQAKVSGLKTEAPAAPARRPAGKKGAGKKK